MCTKTSKTIMTILLFCLFAGSLWADEKNTQIVSSKVTEVTVYQNRAKVIREVTLSLGQGDFSLLFENIPILSDVSSFHASADGQSDASILGLNHQIKEHLNIPQEKAAELEDEITYIEQGRQLEVDYRLAVLERKREFLLSILKQAGETMSEEMERSEMNATSWNDAYNFFGGNLGILSDSLRLYRLWSETLKDTINIKKRELKTLRSTRGNRTRLVQVDLWLETAGEIKVALDYVVSEAGWAPIYDARLNSGGDSTELELFAEIRQKTGEDWDDVKLTLSTSEPTRAAGPGEIKEWFIDVRDYPNVDELLEQTVGLDTYTKPNSDIRIRGGRAGEVAYIVDGVRIGDPLGGYGPVNLGLSLTGSSMESSNFVATFDTKRNETVISGGRATRASIAKWTLEAKTNLVCRPKLNQSVFREVEITNQFDSPLLPGQISLFAGSDFIGKTNQQNLIAPGQTFDLPFGIENRIEVKRKLISNKKSVSDDRIKIIQTIEIKLKNWSQFVGELTLEEPFPISQDNRIKVKHKKMDPKPDEIDDLGKASWKLTLQPGEEKIVEFTFEISHPKEMRLSGI